MKKYDNLGEYLKTWVGRHESADWSVETTDMDPDGMYMKYYTFSDGFQIIEVNRPVWRKAEAVVTVEGIPVKIQKDVKLFQTEIWNNEDAKSEYFYEVF